ncbi:hypothetical protein M408DRAFT_170271 [Serendipita vermifera MAFF 305830]|uniref:WSC domain-containing protein n=1 Tax=Serendipita vermifera MAFF 305830 TaxID=933852 RepID=A0A0C2W037_SERVB|nr:hypothetical protein M408DRAFT_170271 [Serendipita vermifera MAFF 305830]
MLLSTLLTFTPLVTNALFFEPPSAKRHAPIRRTLSTRAPANGGANWVKLGCYIDTVNPRALSAATTVSDNGMTNAYCQEFCDAHGFSIAGTEWSKECFCGAAIDGNLLTADSDCDMTCTETPEVCGGSARLTVWQNQGTVTDPNTQTIGDWTGQGCYTDSVQNRALPNRKWIDGMTVEKCTAACFAENFKYAGLEYGNECYCSNNIITSAGVGVPATDGCDMSCEGNAAQTCGSGNRLNLYSFTGTSNPAQIGTSNAVQIPSTGDWTLKGCYTDQVNARAIAVRQYVDGAMTVEKCTAKCLSLGYSLSGLEYANECYCSSAIGSSGSPTTDGCTMPCEGAASTEICGGSDRLTVYEYTGSALGSAPTVLDSYDDWSSQGCYVDAVNARVLTTIATAVAPMTVGNCVDACSAAGYTVAGIEYSSECYCGSALPPVAATDGCVMKCDGDSTHTCGGPDRLNVYQKAVAAPAPAPVPAPPATPATQYRVRIMKAGGTQLGYIRQQIAKIGMPTITTDVSEAATYEMEGPATNSDLFDLRQSNPSDANKPYLGARADNTDYQFIAYVKQTPEGSTGVPSGIVWDEYFVEESRMWKKDPATSQLNPFWVKPDGSSSSSLYLRYNGPGDPEWSYLVSMFDPTFYIFVDDDSVNFYLEEVSTDS